MEELRDGCPSSKDLCNFCPFHLPLNRVRTIGSWQSDADWMSLVKETQNLSQPHYLENDGIIGGQRQKSSWRTCPAPSFYTACVAQCLNKEQSVQFINIFGWYENNIILIVSMEKEKCTLLWNLRHPTGEDSVWFRDGNIWDQLHHVK